jgi:integrase
MNALENVAMMKQNTTVYGHINTWLNENATLSINTTEGYERYIRMFFNTIRNGKRLEDLQPEDLYIDLPLMLEYQNLLFKSKEWKNSTINFMIDSIRSLYSYLSILDYNVKPKIFKYVKDLPDDTMHIGNLTPDEAIILAELARGEQRDGLKKKALILLAATTSIRKDAITQIKLSHIRKNEEVEGMYIINSDELFDKTRMVYKDINEDVYNLLVESHGERSEDSPIFNYSHAGLDQIIKRLCNKAKIDHKRRISFHSLKKVGVQWTYDVYGLRAAQKQAGHASPETTSKSYLKEERNLAANMFNQIDENVFEQLNRDEMLVLLRSFGNGVGSQLRGKAKEIVSKRVDR